MPNYDSYFNDLDFNVCRSEEVMFLLTLKVYKQISYTVDHNFKNTGVGVREAQGGHVPPPVYRRVKKKEIVKGIGLCHCINYPYLGI